MSDLTKREKVLTIGIFVVAVLAYAAGLVSVDKNINHETPHSLDGNN
jgi:hypothetical protein